MPENAGFSLFLGECRIPLDITRLTFDQAGSPVDSGRKDFKFHFRYRDLTITAAFFNDGATARVDLSSWLGRFPFSAESVEQRQALSTIIRAVNDDFGPILSLVRGKIALVALLPLAVPVTAVGLVTRITEFFLRLKPYLDLMAMIRLMGKPKIH
jgi:hypothetical protein